MKRVFASALTICLFFTLFFSVNSFAAPPGDLASETAVLMDAATGQILYDKEMHRRVYPASTTKILTALLVVENARPYEMMTVSETALEEIAWDNSHIWLAPGEQFTVGQGLYAMMLPSANDAANVLAEHIAGSKEAFAQMMTERAHAIGAVNSNFTNAHGLHDPGHYTTAYDMALITRYALNNVDFREYFGTARYTMPATNLNEERPFTNYQYMLVPDTYYYNEDVIGGKVGYTTEARNTMSTAATRNGRTLICTVMGSAVKSAKFSDTEKLLRFGFEEFDFISLTHDQYGSLTVPVVEDGKEIGNVFFRTEKDFSALLHHSVDVSRLTINYSAPDFFAPNEETACAVSFEIDEALPFLPALLGSIDMDYDIAIPTLYTMSLQPGEPQSESALSRTMRIAATAVGGLVLAFSAFVAYRRYKIAKRRKQRRSRLERIRREAALYASAAYPPEPTVRRPPLSADYRPSVVGGSPGGGRAQALCDLPQKKAR